MVLGKVVLFLRSKKSLLEDGNHEIDVKSVSMFMCLSLPHLATHVQIVSRWKDGFN